MPIVSVNVQPQVHEFTNLNLEDIVTPVNVDMYEEMLNVAGYDRSKRKYLVQGFRNGFSLEYGGPKRFQKKSKNLLLRVGDKFELWNKVMNEFKAERYTGSYEEIPFKNFIQSPIGLVPEDKGKKTILIFHMSYPKTGDSVNSGIPEELCTVNYPDFKDAIEICIKAGKNCFCAKSDMSIAFRNVPMDKKSWKYLILKCEHPITGKTYYFVDKCMPFGASISCSIFQEFSDSVAFLVKYRAHKPLVNYLDDYFFAALRKLLCDSQVSVFLDICKDINFPVSLEKTVWGTTILTFLGLLIDTVNQLICIPCDKIYRALDMLKYFLNKRNGKVTVLEVQKLAGFLNFLCKAIVPGRAFVRRLYSLYSTSIGIPLLQYHHVRITEDVRMDLRIWKTFLSQPEVFSRPFMDCKVKSAMDIGMYSDASGSVGKGAGAYCGKHWTVCQWDKTWSEQAKPSIEYLELYAVTISVLLWIQKFSNSAVKLHCDNKTVCRMINNSSTSCKNCMVLVRIIVLHCLKCNVRLTAEWLSTKDNGMADAISRLQFRRVRRLAKGSMNLWPDKLPSELWPISKIWLY